MKQFFQLISQKFAQVIALLVVALILGIGVSVFATNYTDPTCTPPGCNAPVPVNVENITQTKTGTLNVFRLGTTEYSFLQGVNTLAGENVFDDIKSSTGAIIKAGTFTSKVPSLFTKAVTVNNTLTADVSTQNPSGGGARNALFLKAAANENENFIVHSTPTVGFWSTATNKLGDLIANAIQLSGGAGVGKVLTSDVDGKATWQPLPTAGVPTTLTKVSIDTALNTATNKNSILTTDSAGTSVWRHFGSVANENITYVSTTSPFPLDSNCEASEKESCDVVQDGNLVEAVWFTYCPDDYIPIGGGGRCSLTNDDSSYYARLDQSFPARVYYYNTVSGATKRPANPRDVFAAPGKTKVGYYAVDPADTKNGWVVSCQGSDGDGVQHVNISAYAVCMKKN